MSQVESERKKKAKQRVRVTVDIPSDDDDDLVELKSVADRRALSSLNLLTDAYSEKTKVKYKGAVLDFVSWCDDQGIAQMASYEELDLWLFEYIQDMYERKINDPSASGGKGKAAATVCGVIMLLPRARFELMTAAKAVRNWNKLSPAESYPPLTKELCNYVAIRMMLDGHEAEAIGCLLAFDCLLRVNELASLRVSDVAYGDSRLPSEYKQMVLRIGKAKTGRNQPVVVSSDVVTQLVAGWRKSISSNNKDAPLFPFTADRFRRIFKKTCASLGLSSLYVPHSLRHGGATHLFMVEKKRIEDIMIIGRWAVLTSCKRYVQAGRALLLTVEVPDEAARLSIAVSSDVLAAFKQARTLSRVSKLRL